MKISQDKNKSLRWGFVCLVLCIITLVSINGISTMSKYVLSINSYRQAETKAFYFTSDLLVEGDTPVYQIANFVPGTNTISFNLRNYADEFHVSETDIEYTVTTDNPLVTGEESTIELNGTTPINQTINLSVPLSAFTGRKVKIRVTATAVSPYTATLAAEFELYRKITEIDYSVYDAEDNNTITLTITTGDVAETVNVSYPAAVFPDRTDDRLTVNGNNTACSFVAAANAQYSFVFFKSDPSLHYSKTDFTIS